MECEYARVCVNECVGTDECMSANVACCLNILESVSDVLT